MLLVLDRLGVGVELVSRVVAVRAERLRVLGVPVAARGGVGAASRAPLRLEALVLRDLLDLSVLLFVVGFPMLGCLVPTRAGLFRSSNTNFLGILAFSSSMRACMAATLAAALWRGMSF